ncbi:MarC family protein [Methylomarinum vadi]|uniref:MarC family protein n=1 Tax=Methylomarinum vadi TaxID=438855 RepID=UPI0004DFC870|nr:MarC family protein [Methylomarinum vadi]
MIESALLLFLVIDPFGNLPFVLSVIDNVPMARYRRIILRETALAFLILALFALAGERLLGYLNIEQAAIAVAGGVILFLISLKMIFRSASEIFDDNYRDDPFLVPIAVPSLAGPSAITAVMILRTQQQTAFVTLMVSLCLVMVVTASVFLLGRQLSTRLGRRGLRATEKLMGLLLNLVAVNMVLVGIRDFLSAG